MVFSGLLRRVTLVRTDVSEVPPKRRFLQEPRGVTTQKTPFFIVTAVNTTNLTFHGTARRYIPGAGALHTHCREDHKLNIHVSCFSTNTLTNMFFLRAWEEH
jgi:hypothetical protein